jgi:hypothetical protein
VSRFTPATRSALRGTALAAVAALVAVGAAGCAGDGGDGAGAATTAPAVTATATQAAAPAGGYGVGDELVVTAKTPKALGKALAAHRVAVVTFVLRGVADDDAVAAAVRRVRSSAPRAAYLTYDVGSGRRYGDLVDLLGVTGTPTVVVIGRDGRIVNVWRSLADADMLRQSVAEAAEAPPV